MRHLLLALVVFASACADGGPGATGPDGGPVSDGAVAPSPDPGQPAPAPPPLSTATIAAAAAEIQALLAQVAYTRSVRIEDLSTQQLIYTENPALLLKPASNTKLYTTAAALEILSFDHGMSSRVVGTASIDATGTLDGDLYLIGEHDFTPSDRFYAGPQEPLDRIAATLAGRGLKQITGDVYAAGEWVYAGNSVGTLDVTAERASLIAPLDAALTAAGIAHAMVKVSSSLDPIAGAVPLLEHDPIPLGVACGPLNADSHNEFADLLHRHLGWRVEGSSSAAAGSVAVLDWLGSTGVPTAGVSFEDGSGLSHNNRTSAEVTLGLFRFMETSPVGPPWRRTLAVAGERGTLAGRLTEPDTHGRVFAKTGTLSDTIALSGFLEHRHDGQRYAFSMLLNAVTNASTARAVLDDVVRVIARNLRAAAPRLAAPRLRYARPVGWAGLAELAWESVPGASGYLVWRSDDGERWPLSQARLYQGDHALLGDLAAEGPSFLRVTAIDPAGLQSDPSVVFGVSASASPAAVLLVDANDRWLTEPQLENVLVQHNSSLAQLAIASASRVLASADHDEIARGAFELAPYPSVLWAAGEESQAQVTLAPEEQSALASYLAGGGTLLISGAELAWDLDQRGTASDRQFLGEVLQVAYVADQANTYEIEGTPGSAFATVRLSSFLAFDGMDVRFPDVLAPTGAAVSLLRYVGGTGGAAAVGVPERTVVMGFPIESVGSLPQRRALVESALSFLGK